MREYYFEPRWTVSYQGRVDYQVGPPVGIRGHSTVQIRHQLPHYCIPILFDPEEFWRSNIASVGVVLWKNCPWHVQPHQFFPDPEVATKFPLNPVGRFCKDWTIEVQGEFPQLVATRFGFEMQAEFDQVDRSDYYQILWQGTAPQMTKELWFTTIFPHLYPAERSRIIRHLIQKQVDIPSHPQISDTAYTYCVCQGQWQVRLDRTYLPTQFYNAGKGWVDDRGQATIFYRKDEADQAVQQSGLIVFNIG